MAKIAEIKKRIQSVQAIGSITNAMYLVSLAKLQKNQKRIETLTVYKELVTAHMAQVFAASRYTDFARENPFLRERTSIKNVAYIVYTSDLGLCGGYNVFIMKALQEKILQNSGENPYVYMIGKVGITKAPYYGVNVYKSLSAETDILRYSELREGVVNDIIDKFYQGELDALRIVYMDYLNPLVQKIEVKQIIPIAAEEQEKMKRPSNFVPYTIFEPSPDEVIDYLLKKNIKSTAYICYLESQTSEEAMRRLAMDNANKNGKELVDKLQLEYNHVRQATITQEMAEIISGSENT